jgi:hypothetical protein
MITGPIVCGGVSLVSIFALRLDLRFRLSNHDEVILPVVLSFPGSVNRLDLPHIEPDRTDPPPPVYHDTCCVVLYTHIP